MQDTWMRETPQSFLLQGLTRKINLAKRKTWVWEKQERLGNPQVSTLKRYVNVHGTTSEIAKVSGYDEDLDSLNILEVRSIP